MNIKIINKNPIKYNEDCIGECSIKKRGIYYHPILANTSIIIKNDETKPTCPILPKNKKINELKPEDYYKKCEHINNLSDDFISYFAITDQDFLERIYDITDYLTAEKFINNKLDKMYIYSQQRICNAIYRCYKDDINFPNKKFVNIIQNILKHNFNIKLSTNKIIDILNKSKSKEIQYSLYDLFIKKK